LAGVWFQKKKSLERKREETTTLAGTVALVSDRGGDSRMPGQVYQGRRMAYYFKGVWFLCVCVCYLYRLVVLSRGLFLFFAVFFVFFFAPHFTDPRHCALLCRYRS
jgi:hypothetical protein